MTLTGHRYIVRDKQILGGEPVIQGTRTPVRAVVELWRLGSMPEQIATSLPHLTLAQIFDALSCSPWVRHMLECSSRCGVLRTRSRGDRSRF